MARSEKYWTRLHGSRLSPFWEVALIGYLPIANPRSRNLTSAFLYVPFKNRPYHLVETAKFYTLDICCLWLARDLLSRTCCRSLKSVQVQILSRKLPFAPFSASCPIEQNLDYWHDAGFECSRFPDYNALSIVKNRFIVSYSIKESPCFVIWNPLFACATWSEALIDVIYQKWSHQLIVWPWFSVTFQYMSTLYLLPFRS